MPPKRKQKTEDEADIPAKKSKDDKDILATIYPGSLVKNISPKKSASGKEWNFKFTSWNINGLRAWLKRGCDYIDEEKADVIGLQEIKCPIDNIPPEAKWSGYTSIWSSADKKGYAGTGALSKVKPLNVTYGIGKQKHDEEGRTITLEYDKFFFITSYVPNSGRGLPRLPYRQKEWDPDFAAYLKELDKKKPIIVCGDLNVAHKEIDLANPKTNTKTAGFTKEEREGFSKLLESVDLVDTFRHLYPDRKGAYSFWTYMGNARGKNVGWRLDYFLISRRLIPSLCDHEIRSGVMGSDHCPIVLYMNL